MARPKRWPKNAEAFRTESVFHAREISRLCEQARREFDNRLLVKAFIAEIQLKAVQIEAALTAAKNGRED